MAEAIAASGPVANRLAKRAIDLGGDRSLPEALQLEWECYLETLDTEDRLEALRAFGEKRTPKFEGR
jgi:enoyl-CoA hydratase/carnithine racemase